MATIKEIAELSGVSRGTVDRVLNNRGSVSKETARRVREIAEKLNYIPNKAGLVLAAQKKNLKFGVILFNESNPFFREVLDGVHAKARELSCYNCQIIIKQVSFNETSQYKAMEELLYEGIHGLVISPYNSPYIAAEIDRYYEFGIPVITVNTDIHSKRIAYVGSNYLLSGETAAGLLGRMTFGDTYVGIVSGSSHVLCHTERIAGFTQVLARRFPHIKIAATVENHDDDSESFEQVSAMLLNHPEINALFFAAAGVSGGCRAVVSHGLSGKVKIFTFDNVSSTTELIKKGIISATICQQPYKQGYWPLDLLSHYLLEGAMPENELNYVDIDIRIMENIQ